MLADDESLDFSVLQALLGASSEPLAGAPEATRERVALRSLQELASLVPAGGDAAATAGVRRVDGARSCEDALSRLINEVEISGKLEKDLLAPFSQDIQETIRTKKITLPEVSFQLLKGVDPWITSMTPTSQLEHNGTEQCANDQTLRSSHKCVNIEKPVFPTDNAVVQQDTMTNLDNESETGNLHKDPSAPNCVLHQPCTPESSPYVPLHQERSPIVEGNMSVGSVPASAGFDAPLQGSCNGANQGSKSATEDRMTFEELNAEDRMAFEQLNADESPFEVSGANKASLALHDDDSMMKNYRVHSGLTVQTAPVSQNCNVTLHDNPSEANCFSEHQNENNRTDVQNDNCRTSIPSSSKDRDRESAKKTPNEERSEDTSPEISVRSKDQDIDDTLEGLSQQVCIKCGEDGELLTCSDCSVAAHDRCFGPSVTFEGTDFFYCPVCTLKKATEDYLKAMKKYFEARKNAPAYIGTAQVSKQHDEQLNGVQPGAAKRDGHSNGSDMSKRSLAHWDEEPHQQRKKQKINARGNGYPEEILTEKVPFQNSGPASMNKHSVLQNNSKARVEDPEKKQKAGDKEAHTEAGNDNPSHETAASSQRACDPPLNQDNEADKEGNLLASNQSGGKRSSPPWRNMRHEKESAVPSKSRKVTPKQGQRRKRGSVHPQKRYSNPVAPPGRRTNCVWTAEEVAILREAVPIFTPQDGAPFPWARMLEYGSHVFNRRRLPLDLRDKWRNLNKAGMC